MNLHRTSLVALALAAAALAPPSAVAGSAYDNCTGYIAALPAVINTQGTWCLNKDLTTPIATGVAITINATYVTLDCNDFKLVGIGGATQTLGIASTANNATVRRCQVRGFLHGTSMMGNYATIEDNRFDNNREAGVWSDGEHHTIRRNLITNSGGTPSGLYGYGVYLWGTGDVIDNTIAGVVNAENEGWSYGIEIADSHGGSVRGNRIRKLSAPDIGQGAAIHVGNASDGVVIEDNVMYLGPDDYFSGVKCDSLEAGMYRRNAVTGSNIYGAYDGCIDGGGNYSLP